MLTLAKAMIKFEFIQFKRYAFNSISGLVTIYLIFILLFYGARAALPPGPAQGDNLSAIVVGFFVWTLAVFSYSGSAMEFTQEAQSGTLEQISMSPFGLTRVAVLRLTSALILQFAILLAMLVLMMATSGKWLNLDLISVVPLMLLTVMGVNGLGFIMGGLSVVYKRVEASLQILQFAFIFIIVAPLSKFTVAKYLPLAWGNHLMQQVMVQGESIFTIKPADTLFLVAVSAAWLLAGMAIFRVLELKARSDGKLAHY